MLNNVESKARKILINDLWCRSWNEICFWSFYCEETKKIEEEIESCLGDRSRIFISEKVNGLGCRSCRAICHLGEIYFWSRWFENQDKIFHKTLKIDNRSQKNRFWFYEVSLRHLFFFQFFIFVFKLFAYFFSKTLCCFSLKSM